MKGKQLNIKGEKMNPSRNDCHNPIMAYDKFREILNNYKLKRYTFIFVVNFLTFKLDARAEKVSRK